jgi:BAAT / Acyl-CoA thioester hydrolase C terminal
MACGDLDKVWTSCAFAHAIQQALGTRATAQTYDTGHLVGLVPAYPSTLTSLNQAGHTIVVGGSPSATAEARGQEWPQILRFLNNLHRR